MSTGIGLRVEQGHSARLLRHVGKAAVDPMHGIDERRAYEHFEEWAGEDTYFPVEAELEAMTAAGFVVCRAWTDTPNTLLVGTKPRSTA